MKYIWLFPLGSPQNTAGNSSSCENQSRKFHPQVQVLADGDSLIQWNPPLRATLKGSSGYALYWDLSKHQTTFIFHSNIVWSFTNLSDTHLKMNPLFPKMPTIFWENVRLAAVHAAHDVTSSSTFSFRFAAILSRACVFLGVSQWLTLSRIRVTFSSRQEILWSAWIWRWAASSNLFECDLAPGSVYFSICFWTLR